MKFNYQARTKEGKVETGTIEAHSKDDAVLLLQKYNIFVTSLEEEITKESFLKNIRFEKKVSRKELAVFFRQLSVMLQSRVPVVQSLSSLVLQARNTNFKKAIAEIATMVEEGKSLSDSMVAYPKIFDSFYISLIKSGEVSGNISGVLNYISENLEREDDIISQVRQASVYPVLVIIVMFIVIGIIVSQVVPRIRDLIVETNVAPSLFTKFTLGFYQLVENYWWAFLAVLAFIIVSAIFYFRTKEGKYNFDRLSLKIPFMGDILKKVFLTRFCSNISTLVVAGVSINKALKITEDTVNNIVYKEIVIEIGKQVSEGEKISSVMMKYPDYFPAFVVQMIKVGEETGKLDKTLMEIVIFYQKEIKRAIDLFSSLLEPTMIVILGIVVGFIAISVIGPLYETLGTI